jgi:hypothetical protein
MRVERTLVGLLLTSAVAIAGCQGRLAYNLPPAARLMEPGPGVGGPGPGVIPAATGAGMMGGGVYPAGYGDGMGGPGGGMGPMGGVCQASYMEGGGGEICQCGGAGCGMCGGRGRILGGLLHGRNMGGCVDGGATMGGYGGTSQIAFLGADGVQIAWDISGSGMFDSSPLVVPGRQDFYQGGIYRLKLSNLPGRPGVELYPTLEVAPVTPRTDAFLAHSPIPVQFTEEDFDQALSGNFVTKVIYLPDPEFQELALAGAETLVSTRLDPGTDPIAEADRRGAILAIIRLGNKDLEGGRGFSGQGQVVPALHGVEPASYQARGDFATQAVYNESYDPSTGQPTDGGVVPAQYCYGGGADGNMPVGMPTAGFAPPIAPPNMIASAEWGMPMSGTPIGLPGPPHIPLGTPAGLQQHVMKNKTRVMMPPPVARVDVTVKQRPGLNYPRPVDRVRVDEVHREQLKLLPNWLTDLFHPGQSAAYQSQMQDCN